jgi:hypothetical protein
MKVEYKLQNLEAIFESMVFAVFHRKNPNLIKRLFSRSESLIMYYMVLVPNGSLFEADFVEEKQIQRIIDENEPQEWSLINKHKSFVKYSGVTHLSMTMYDLSCYSWMLDEKSFFVDVYENNDKVRGLLYKHLPDLIDEIYEKQNE